VKPRKGDKTHMLGYSSTFSPCYSSEAEEQEGIGVLCESLVTSLIFSLLEMSTD
jgi:hypothetical protein